MSGLLDAQDLDRAADVAQLAVREGGMDGQREGADVAARQRDLPGSRDHDRYVVPLRRETVDEILRCIEDDLRGLQHGQNDPTGTPRARVNTVAEGRVRTDFYIHPAKRHAVYERNAHTCQCCGYKDDTRTGANLSVEHITARSKGGEVQGRLDEKSTNLSTLCMDCNGLKNDNSPKEFNRLLEAKGAKHGFDVKKLRDGSRRALDLKEGAKLAKNATAYRAANKIKEPPTPPPDVMAEPMPAEHEAAASAGGSGEHCHDEQGHFAACRLAVVRAARKVARLLRARLAAAP